MFSSTASKKEINIKIMLTLISILLNFSQLSASFTKEGNLLLNKTGSVWLDAAAANVDKELRENLQMQKLLVV